MLRCAAQRNFTQGNEVALAEKILRSTFGLLRLVHLACLEAREQLVGRDVHQNDFIGAVKHRVGHGLVNADAGDGPHGAVEAFQVLHIQGGPHVNARAQQFLNVLPAFGVA